MSLLDLCVCGNRGGQLARRMGITISTCGKCGTARQLTDRTREQVEAQYLGSFHSSSTRHEGCRPYRERYEHDRKIAVVRWFRYVQICPAIERTRSALDVGAANGAFVDHLRSLAIGAFGIDPDPAMAADYVATSTLEGFEGMSVDMVTMHDVLEHLVDPIAAVRKVSGLLEQRGFLVVDVPNVWDGKGDHHWKHEHLWYFTRSQLEAMVNDAGLSAVAYDEPIGGKQVLYARKFA